MKTFIVPSVQTCSRYVNRSSRVPQPLALPSDWSASKDTLNADDLISGVRKRIHLHRWSSGMRVRSHCSAPDFLDTELSLFMHSSSLRKELLPSLPTAASETGVAKALRELKESRPYLTRIRNPE